MRAVWRRGGREAGHRVLNLRSKSCVATTTALAHLVAQKWLAHQRPAGQGWARNPPHVGEPPERSAQP
eukprot:12548458-Alexandrium_andersonii.AAC.1